MDAISLIRDDHREIEALFEKYEGLGPRAKKSKRQTIDKLIRLLSIHTAVEEQILYPAVREWIEDMDAPVFHALEEHLVVKWELAALQDLEPDDERFDAKARVVIDVTRQHVKQEEREILPALRDVLTRPELRELGAQIDEAKRAAPTRPHPRLPDEPPLQPLAGMAAGMVDRARDRGEETIDRARDLGEDVVGTIRERIRS